MELFFKYLIEVIDLFKFAIIVQPYQLGVHTRLGKYLRTMEPGFYFFVPFAFDTVIVHECVLTTRSTGEQTLTTTDNHQIVVSTVVTYTLEDMRKILLEIESAETVLQSFGLEILGDLISGNTLSFVMSGQFKQAYTRKLTECAERLGMNIHSVGIVTLAEIHTLRLINNTD